MSRSFPADPLAPAVGEILPTTTRDLTFRFIGRDNAANGGAWDFDEIGLAVDSGSGPFLNTTSATWAWPSKEVTWDVAGTDLPPISCSSVDILLSRDGGASFEEALLLSTPNDGMETVVMPPATAPTNARVRIRCSNNIFFSEAIATLEPFSFAPYQFLLDRLEINHSGGVVFMDEFDDDVPPPSLGYSVEGAVGPEASDLLLLDEVNAIPGLPGSFYQSAGQILDAPLSENFSVSSRYKFALPNPLRGDAQSVFLTYEDPITKEMHRVVASFTATDSLPLALEVRDENRAAGLEVVLAEASASAVIGAGVDRIELRLDVAAGTNLATASLIGFDNDVEDGSVSIPGAALVPGSVIPSAGFHVSVIPEPGFLLSLMIGALGMGFSRAKASGG